MSAILISPHPLTPEGFNRAERCAKIARDAAGDCPNWAKEAVCELIANRIEDGDYPCTPTEANAA